MPTNTCIILDEFITGWSIKQDSSWRFNSNRLEQARMSQGELNHFLNLCELLSSASNVVIANGVQRVFLFFSLDWLTLAMDDCIGRNDAEGRRICLNNLKLFNRIIRYILCAHSTDKTSSQSHLGKRLPF